MSWNGYEPLPEWKLMYELGTTYLVDGLDRRGHGELATLIGRLLATIHEMRQSAAAAETAPSPTKKPS